MAEIDLPFHEGRAYDQALAQGRQAILDSRASQGNEVQPRLIDFKITIPGKSEQFAKVRVNSETLYINSFHNNLGQDEDGWAFLPSPNISSRKNIGNWSQIPFDPTYNLTKNGLRPIETLDRLSSNNIHDAFKNISQWKERNKVEEDRDKVRKYVLISCLTVSESLRFRPINRAITRLLDASSSEPFIGISGLSTLTKMVNDWEGQSKRPGNPDVLILSPNEHRRRIKEQTDIVTEFIKSKK